MAKKQKKGLTLLGNKNTLYPFEYSPKILETFDNKHYENDYFVKFICPEFSCICPITGQPDFAQINIAYIPDKKLIESKSLKLYLFSFRNCGNFHEDCVNSIMKDIKKLIHPRYIEVIGLFSARGGIKIHPFANYGNQAYEIFAKERLLNFKSF